MQPSHHDLVSLPGMLGYPPLPYLPPPLNIYDIKGEGDIRKTIIYIYI